MIILHRVSQMIEDIISDGVQDEYTRIKSVYSNPEKNYKVYITQINGTNGNEDNFFAFFYCGKILDFRAKSEDEMGEWCDGVGIQLGEFQESDTFELTEKGNEFLTRIPYLSDQTAEWGEVWF